MTKGGTLTDNDLAYSITHVTDDSADSEPIPEDHDAFIDGLMAMGD